MYVVYGGESLASVGLESLTDLSNNLFSRLRFRFICQSVGIQDAKDVSCLISSTRRKLVKR